MTSHVSLTAPELDELQTILLSGTNDDRLELSGLHGLQTAVVSSPKPINPDEWLPLVGHARPERMLAHDPESFAPLLLASDASTPRQEYAGAWCNGYLAGVLLRGNEWENFLGERTVEDGLSLIAIGSEDFPSSKLPPGLDRTALHDGLAEAAVAIHHFFQQHR
jgi:uncharacterized protein YecA (UPF0149 family)